MSEDSCNPDWWDNPSLADAEAETVGGVVKPNVLIYIPCLARCHDAGQTHTVCTVRRQVPTTGYLGPWRLQPSG